MSGNRKPLEKHSIKESSAFCFAASGISLAGIFTIYSRGDISDYTIASLCSFALVIPFFIALSLLYEYIHFNYDSNRNVLNRLFKGSTHNLFVLVSCLLLASAIGLMLHDLSPAASYIFMGSCLIAMSWLGMMLSRANRLQEQESTQ